MAELDRGRYAALYGPTAGDRVRLADTDLLVSVSRVLGAGVAGSVATLRKMPAEIGEVQIRASQVKVQSAGEVLGLQREELQRLHDEDRPTRRLTGWWLCAGSRRSMLARASAQWRPATRDARNRPRRT